MKNGILRFSNQPIEEWVLDYPQQVAISVLHLILCQEIQDILSHADYEHLDLDIGNPQTHFHEEKVVIGKPDPEVEALTAPHTHKAINGSCPAFYLRALRPQHWAHITPPIEEHRPQHLGGANFPPGVKIYLDGSGGKHTKDPRIRRCGYSIVAILAPNKKVYGIPYNATNVFVFDTTTEAVSTIDFHLVTSAGDRLEKFKDMNDCVRDYCVAIEEAHHA